MNLTGVFTQDGTIDLNSRKTLWSVFLVGIIAPEVFIVQPGFVQGLVEYLGFDDQGAGYTASAEMFGLAATTVLMTFIAHRPVGRQADVEAPCDLCANAPLRR